MSAPDSILMKFPPTRIIICEADPLKDPSIEFSLRLKKLGIDSNLYIMKDYIHGFNSFDTPLGISEYHNGTILTEEIMRDLLLIPQPSKSS